MPLTTLVEQLTWLLIAFVKCRIGPFEFFLAFESGRAPPLGLGARPEPLDLDPLIH